MPVVLLPPGWHPRHSGERGWLAPENNIAHDLADLYAVMLSAIGINEAMKARIEAGDAELGRHLNATIRTGTFCSYRADLDPSIRCEVDVP